MHSVSSRIWTRVAVSISYGDNHYTEDTSVDSCYTTDTAVYYGYVTLLGIIYFQDLQH